jgi:hypothetical protein
MKGLCGFPSMIELTGKLIYCMVDFYNAGSCREVQLKAGVAYRQAGSHAEGRAVLFYLKAKIP